LPVFAEKGLHEYVFRLASELIASNAQILELGSGSGAFACRLVDNGYQVTCCDITAENFGILENVPFIEADLNSEFSTQLKNTYDAVIALEIIEHLENPWQFLRQIVKLVRPGGTVLISTPNVDTPRSLLSFAKYGHFKYFKDSDAGPGGHISPISQWQLVKILERAGLSKIRIEGFGAPWGSGLRHLGAKITSLLMKKNPAKFGPIVIGVAERPYSQNDQ
jgi:SAM-dependent methyltransferase